ncbi:MAG: hypothetical protein V7K40_26025 [Nostoc sp.]
MGLQIAQKFISSLPICGEQRRTFGSAKTSVMRSPLALAEPSLYDPVSMV